MCDLCEYRFQSTKPYLEGDYQLIHLLDLLTSEDRVVVNAFLEANTIIKQDTFYECFDVGEAVRSSYISKTRDRDIELTHNVTVLKELAVQSLLVYLAIKRFLVTEKIHQLIVFNGRWDYYRAAFRAAQAVGVPVLVYENLRSGGYIELFENSFPHVIKAKQTNYETFWNSVSDLSYKKQRAAEFFQRKRNGEVVVDRAYTQHQKRNFIPPEIDLSKKLIVLFNSSDDEIAAIGGDEYANPFFTDQAEGIQYIVDFVGRKIPEVSLVIRMHPNLKGIEFNYLAPIYGLQGKYSNVFVLAPEHPVDSYALLDQAWKVITFGSSIGMEANYWRKPVILLAKSFYYYAGLAYVPETKSHIPGLLIQELQPKPVENSERIAFYLMEGGVKSKYYNFQFGKNFNFKTKNITRIPILYQSYFRLLKLLKIKNT
jgi:hypothetical protein